MNHDPLSGRDHDEEPLRRLLADAVSEVEPRDGLDRIHARTKVTPMSRRPWLLGAAAAVVATAATVLAVATLSGDGDGTSEPPPVAASPTGDTTPDQQPTTGQEPSQEPSQEPPESTAPSEPSTSPAAGGQVTVPVYYAGDTSRGPRLFREFHRTPAVDGDELTTAVHRAVTASPVDADYRTSWPAGTDVEAAFDGDTVTVDLLGETPGALRDRPSTMSRAEAEIAVQQLVYTAQAAVQERAPVRLLLDGQVTDTVLGVPTAEPLAEAPAADVLAQVWVIDPAEGARVSSPFTVTGLANAFEANVQWELMDGDRVVERGFTMAEECCRMAPYSFRVEAPAGEYTLVVHDTDPSDGEGFAPWRDTKQVVVEP